MTAQSINLRTQPLLADALRVPETPLFSQDWWLDAVAPGAWDEVTVDRDGVQLARMRFATRSVPGLGLVLRMPVVTPYLGPEIFISERSGARGIGEQHSLVNELINALPTAEGIDVTCHPNLDSWLPFYWEGFEQTTRYTHRLDDLSNLDNVWSDFSSSTRRAIRKAEKHLEIKICDDASTLAQLHERTFEHQGEQSDLDSATLERLHNAVVANDSGEIVAAVDADGCAHAAMLVVYNSSVAYYLVGGSDPEKRNSGAMSLLLWHQIRKQSTRVTKFDFEGSMVPGIERFVRGFGALPVPVHAISRFSYRARLARNSVEHVRSLRNRIKRVALRTG